MHKGRHRNRSHGHVISLPENDGDGQLSLYIELPVFGQLLGLNERKNMDAHCPPIVTPRPSHDLAHVYMRVCTRSVPIVQHGYLHYISLVLHIITTSPGLVTGGSCLRLAASAIFPTPVNGN